MLKKIRICNQKKKKQKKKSILLKKVKKIPKILMMKKMMMKIHIKNKKIQKFPIFNNNHNKQ